MRSSQKLIVVMILHTDSFLLLSEVSFDQNIRGTVNNLYQNLLQSSICNL